MSDHDDVEIGRLNDENEHQLQLLKDAEVLYQEELEENERLKACIDAALDLLATRHTISPECSYCRELSAALGSVTKALQGKS